MSRQGWYETLIAAETAGTNLTASTTATSILPGAAKFTIPANYFDVGRSLRIKAMCQVSNIVTTPGTLTLDVRFNTTPIVVFNGGAMQLSSTAHTTLPLQVEINLTCRAVGSGTSANLMGSGLVVSQTVVATAVADSTTNHGVLVIPNVTPAVGTGFDSTVANVVDLFATFSLNNANAIQLQQYTLESIN